MNWIFWAIIGTVAAFFAVVGVLVYIGRAEPRGQRRTLKGLARDFIAAIHKRPEFPVTIVLTQKELEAVAVCGIHFPRERGHFEGSEPKVFVLHLTVPELNDFYRDVMQASQARIARSARREISTLSGATLSISILAGELHQVMLAHWQEKDLKPDSVSVDLGARLVR